MTGRTWKIIAALAGPILIAAALNQVALRLTVFWTFGLAFGFVLQRSRFCFSAAFHNLYILRNGRVMKGVLAGLAVATLGFALVMYNLVPNDLGLGILPPNANVVPLGFHLLLAGILFGLGMVVAGGCFVRTLCRIGEGYVLSISTLGGVLVGVALLLHNWNWWWRSYISSLPKVWLPHSLGWAGAVLLTVGVLVIIYLLIRWWEHHGGVIAKPVAKNQPATTFGQKVSALRRVIVHNTWPAALTGVILGMLNTLQYLFERPWGVTGEFSRWSNSLLSLIHLSPPELLGTTGSCAVGSESPEVLTWGLMINGGMIFGSFVGASLTGEFRVRIPRQKKRYLPTFMGGLLMGYGAGLASGCTIGAFFSSVPSLGLNGLVFGGGLAIGAFLGVQVVKRIT